MAPPAVVTKAEWPRYCTVEGSFKLCEATEEKLEYPDSYGIVQGYQVVAKAAGRRTAS